MHDLDELGYRARLVVVILNGFVVVVVVVIVVVTPYSPSLHLILQASWLESGSDIFIVRARVVYYPQRT
jgi:hypothetical protein